MEEIKIDLMLLNSLVKELNNEFAAANDSKNSDPLNNKIAYVSKLAKCLGLASAVSTEAAALTHEFSKNVRINSAGDVPATDLGLSDLSSLFGLGFGDSVKKKN